MFKKYIIYIILSILVSYIFMVYSPALFGGDEGSVVMSIGILSGIIIGLLISIFIKINKIEKKLNDMEK